MTNSSSNMNTSIKSKSGQHFYAGLWPAVAVGAAVTIAVCAYQPLTFNLDDYESKVAYATDDLSALTIDESSASSAGALTEEAALRESLSATTSAFDTSAVLKDGTYTGSAYGYKSYITVQVTISEGKIASISILSEDDDESYMSKAKILLAQVINAQSPNIDTVSGATYSSNGILNAIKQALSQAASNTYAQTLVSVDETAKNTTSGLISSNINFSEADSNPVIDSSGNVVEVSVDGPYLDGTYTASAYCENSANPDDWTPYYLTVVVNVKNGIPSISDVYGANTAEDQNTILDEFDNSNDAYISKAAWGSRKQSGLVDQYAQSSSSYSQVNAEAISGATYSSSSLREAYGKALYSAAKAYAMDSLNDPADDSNDDSESSHVSLISSIIESIKSQIIALCGR